MKTAADLIEYAQTHQIHLAADGGKLILEAPDGKLTPEFLKSAKACKTELLEALSANKTDAELIKEAFRDGQPVRVWSGVLQEWIWWSPNKEIAERKKQETDEVVYHKGELITLIGRDGQSLKDMHILRKEFDGEIIK